MSLAVYALSADPITFGHLDIIERAAGLFDELVVAIGVNLEKNYTFNLAERTILAEKSLAHLTNVRVKSFEGLLVDFAYEIGATVLVRGVRDTKDLEFERNLAWLGGSQKLPLETVLLFTKPELTQVSSGAVKELQMSQGLIHEYVPLVVKQALEKKLSQQVFLGITGEIGAGKSFVADQLVILAQQAGLTAVHIELDELGHQILEELAEPKYQLLRADLIRNFGAEIVLVNGAISRLKLADQVFTDATKLALLNKLMKAPISVRLRKATYGKKGLIILSAAILAEAKLLPMVNNQVILVQVPEKIQSQRLADRQLTPDQIKARLASQASAELKKQLILTEINQVKFGQLWEIASDDTLLEKLPDLFETIKASLGLTN